MLFRSAQRAGLVKKWPFLPIFEQTGGYTSPFGQCDMALSCPDHVYYLLGKIWGSTGADRSTFPTAQRVGLVKKLPFLPIFEQTGAYTSPFGQCDRSEERRVGKDDHCVDLGGRRIIKKARREARARNAQT